MSEKDRTWSTVSHLSPMLGFCTGIGFWVAPLVLWLVFQDRSRAVAREAKEALNMQLSFLIYGCVIGVLSYLLVGFLMLPFLLLAMFILPIMAAMATAEGGSYRYPLNLRLIP